MPWRTIGPDGSITLHVHAQPGAKRTEITGDHGGCLKIRLAAAAVDGRANDELVAFLAASFAVPRRSVVLVRGERARRKVLRIISPAGRPDREWEKPERF